MAHELIFISGGVRSGKSAYAESLARKAPGERRLYIASGVANDSEMAERITRHRQDRAKDGWWTIEQPQQLSAVLPLIQPDDVVLWDCVTTWLANELYEGFEQGELCVEQPGCMDQKWKELQKTIDAIRKQATRFVIVSNEILDEPLAAPQYQEWLGKIHQWLTRHADQAIEMENGVAIRRK
ncbi:bifunctional adenosylcobinamide kinase/adenosylcobinamide-phosphate guanylyltransferase [Planococcus sp. ISL-109]|uniref:bifunctional adenosylcobinamide kinase/adenosylcobinamide-phosphate guanylyltransferase n=1 Tax=Planococcus sp. ISL-109 TaxID=2819166 RepID=UPI001BE6D27F|nr:bifunctional adenosylcobinamide kinase/adenosylcobinamide-phosphate guanylyltransferase [Planococcus sp. ISL-109]MBT2583028.1 bifunctional adenosylcobinamide kinase/adenosylcobinamide-phosphate guanylyltransferase [Planococcus sp. ISL-109]